MTDLTFKVILVGRPGVGKTAIVRRFTRHWFQAEEMPTIGVDVGVRVVEADGTRIQVEIIIIGCFSFIFVHVYLNILFLLFSELQFSTISD